MQRPVINVRSSRRRSAPGGRSVLTVLVAPVLAFSACTCDDEEKPVPRVEAGYTQSVMACVGEEASFDVSISAYSFPNGERLGRIYVTADLTMAPGLDAPEGFAPISGSRRYRIARDLPAAGDSWESGGWGFLCTSAGTFTVPISISACMVGADALSDDCDDSSLSDDYGAVHPPELTVMCNSCGDAAVIDSGPVDAGPIDAGPIDAGPVDAGGGTGPCATTTSCTSARDCPATPPTVGSACVPFGSPCYYCPDGDLTMAQRFSCTELEPYSMTTVDCSM